MSRSGYNDDCGTWDLVRWRGAVNSAIKGARGQAFLAELLAALDAMPVKELIAGDLEVAGAHCTLGVIGQARGFDLSKIDTYDHDSLAKTFDIAGALAQEIMYINDESIGGWDWVDVEVCGPLQLRCDRFTSIPVSDPLAANKRWMVVRKWVESNIKTTGEAS